MVSYPIAEAKSRFSEVIKTVEGGGEVFITRGTKKEAVAVVVPIDEWHKRNRRQLGTLEGWGAIQIADDWYMTGEEFLGYESQIPR
jgi:prevent-host-death family protein